MYMRIFWCSAAAILVGCGGGTTANNAGTTGSSTSGASTSTGGTGGSQSSTSASSTGAGGGGASRSVIFDNACTETIWVGALNAGGSPLPENGGFQLDPGASHTVVLPGNWSGRFWGRTGCTFDATGKGHCDTGDCGGKAQCAGAGAKPPATLFEPTFAGFGGKDFYDVSLVDGFNLRMSVAPKPGTFTASNPGDPYDCGTPTCHTDVNPLCPAELSLKNAGGQVVGCYSAHQACTANPNDPALACAQLDDLYACRKGGPNMETGSCYSPGAQPTCCGCPSWSKTGSCNSTNPKWALPAKPEAYAKIFKDACPTNYAYPFDDPNSTYTCKGGDYIVTFCPP